MSSAGWLAEYAVPPRDVAKVILSGLKAAGAKAEQAKVWRGKFSTALDLAIDMECPWSHPLRDGTTFAKVRLLVDPHAGTLTLRADGERGDECPRCSQAMIDRWLVTCRGHDENGHPDHEPGWIRMDDFSDDTPDGVVSRVMGDEDWARPDDSPMGHVFVAMEKAHREFEARYS